MLDYPDYLNRGNAMQFIKDIAAPYCQGTGIDVGAGPWPLPGSTPVNHDPTEYADNSLDYVFSSHCLEHIEAWQAALTLWISKIKPGGVVFLYLPHASMTYWLPGGPWVKDEHKWIPTHAEIVTFLETLGMEITEVETGMDTHYGFHIVAHKPE